MKADEKQQKEIMRSRVESLLNQFHDGKMTLEQLNAELLAINPHMYNTVESSSYERWINKNVTDFVYGNACVLSLTSSQSILYGLEDDDEEYEDEY